MAPRIFFSLLYSAFCLENRNKYIPKKNIFQAVVSNYGSKRWRLLSQFSVKVLHFPPSKNRSARSCLQAKTQIRARAFLRFTCSSRSSSYCAWPAKPSYRNQSWGRDCSSGDKLYHCIDIMSSRVSHLPLIATHCCSWENYRVVAPIPSHPQLACPHYTKVASPDNENKVF